jgi:hypothetical protein
MGPTFVYVLDHAEPKTKIQVVQDQLVFGGTQASSCKDANIVVIKASPGACNPILEFWHNYILIIILACALGYRSWIDAVAALGSLSNPPLLILWLEIGRELWLGVDVGYGRWLSGRKTTWRPYAPLNLNLRTCD